MIKLNVTAGTYAANATIPLTQVFNTNNNFNLSNNKIAIRRAGLVDIEGTITLIATAIGDVAIQLVDGNGNILTSATTTLAAIGDYATVPIYDLLRVIYNGTTDYGNVSLVTNAAVTVNNGIITGKYIQ